MKEARVVSFAAIGAAVAAALAASSAARAQQPVASAANSSTAQQAEPLAEVRVTGSRIVRRDLEASSPIVTVGTDAFEKQSQIGMEAALNKMPQFQPADTQFAAQSFVANAFSTPGISTLNLRGVGTNRTLVLVDGRRAQPANATLVVDVNSIPSAAIENVEVISGGASSVYGADAVAGVVNFKLKHDFQGIQLDAQSGITEQGDGAETRLSALLGSNLADGRGNVMFGAEWAKRDAVRQANRDFYVRGWNDPGTPGGGDLQNVSSYVPLATNLPSQAAVDQIFTGNAPGSIGRSTSFFVNPDGTLFKNTLVAGNPALSSVGYTGPMNGIKRTNQGTLAQPDETENLSSPLSRYSLFGRATYDFNDYLSVYVQGNLNSTDVLTSSTVSPATSSTFNVSIPHDAAHPVPAELESLLSSRANPAGVYSVDRYLDFLGPRKSDNQSTVYQAMIGVNGKLGIKDWTYDGFVSHGETHVLNYLYSGFASRQILQLLVQAPNYGKNLTLTSSGSYTSHCTTGLPIFTSFTPSQDCMDAISVRMKNITNVSQNIAEVDTQGGIVDLPAGELRGALGVSYRKDSMTFDPDTLNNIGSVLDTPIGLFAAAGAAGETSVKEAYGELLVPVVKDLPLVKELSLELGGRFSDYNLSGHAWTYKGLANWKVNDFVSFRGGYQYANRQPNIAELYLGTTQAVVSQPDRDPCTSTTAAAYGNVPGNPNRARVQALCSAIIGTGNSTFDLDPNNFQGQNGPNFPFEREAINGNPNLKPEVAKTVTAGVVLRSPFDSAALSQLTASIDYYSIQINDTIGPLDATTIYRECFNADGVSNPTYSLNDAGGYCKLIGRDPVTGGREQVEAPYANLGLTQTSGIDLQINWRSLLADLGLKAPGAVTVSVSGNYLIDFTTQLNPNAPKVQNRGTFGQVGGGGVQSGEYDFRTYTRVGYDVGNWAVGLAWQYMPSIHNAVYATNPQTPLQGAGAYDLFSLNGTWQLFDSLQLRAGIDNLLNRQPEVVGAQAGVTNALGQTVPGFYDLLGRRYYVGLKLKF